MNIAVQICGQPRFTDDFKFLIKNLKGYKQLDWFCYFTGNNQNIPSNKLPSEFWKEIKDTHTASTHLQSILPCNNFVKSFELSDSDYIELPKEPAGVPTPAYKMWYNIFKVNQLRLNYEKENKVNYDMIIRVRPDIGLTEELDISQFIEDIKYSIITPINKIAGHLHLSPDSPRMCDMFAISNALHMNIYSDMINHATTNFFTQSRYSWCTESALALHLRFNNVPITPKNFKISIRGDSN